MSNFSRFHHVGVRHVSSPLAFPRSGSKCQWLCQQIVDPETGEVLAQALLWTYGPVGAFLCADYLTDALLEHVPEPLQTEILHDLDAQVDLRLVAWVRQEQAKACGSTTERRNGGAT